MAEPVKKEADKQTKKEVGYFTSRISALRIYVRQPKDKLDPKGEGAVVVRFSPYYDTYKGDTIRVGFLEVEGAEAVKAVEADKNTQKLTKKEYEEAIKGLRPAPIKVA